jgi:N-acetylmuramic acid 6-phosphate etherase
MSLADALELPQTYGIARDRVVLVLADGETIATRLNGTREDDAAAAEVDMAAVGVGPNDCVIATSASGGTPYTVAGLAAAREAGAATVGIAGNAQARLLQVAEIPVLLATGAEVIAGSTRMGAGTAQKAALNMLSTLMGVHLGHVYDGLMVNVVADNEKLRARAARMVEAIAGVDAEAARLALEAAGNVVKPAVLIASGMGLDEARRQLSASNGNLRTALAALRR